MKIIRFGDLGNMPEEERKEALDSIKKEGKRQTKELDEGLQEILSILKQKGLL